ncbi:MAG: hypothetical protein ACI9OO_001155, partial [Bacteroidia bacterium]
GLLVHVAAFHEFIIQYLVVCELSVAKGLY